MARGKHGAATQRRYDQHAEQQIASLQQELTVANRARQDAERRAAQADALRAALEQATVDRDASVSPEVRRLNAMVVDLQEKVRDANARADLKEDQVWGLWEKVWPFLPGRMEERFEWMLDAMPATEHFSGSGGKTVQDPQIVSDKRHVDPRYQYLMQRIRKRRTTLERPMHTTEARMDDARERAKLCEPEFPQVTEDVTWLVQGLHTSRNLLREVRDLLLAGEVGEAKTRIMELLASKPPPQSHVSRHASRHA